MSAMGPVRYEAPETPSELGKRSGLHNEWTWRDGFHTLFACVAGPDGTILELVETTRS